MTKLLPTCSPLIVKCAAIFATLEEFKALRVAVERFRFAMAGANATADAEIPNDAPIESVVNDWATCGNDATACSTNDDLVIPLCSSFAVQEEPRKPDGMDRGLEIAEKDGKMGGAKGEGKKKPDNRVLVEDTTVYGFAVVDDSNGVDLSGADFASGESADSFEEGEADGELNANLVSSLCVFVLLMKIWA